MNGPLLLLGGTFDPPHLGHLILAACAQDQFGGAPVRFLPAGLQYRKGYAHSPAETRLAMLRLALEGAVGFDVDERDLWREGPTYTVDTLRGLHAEGERNLVLLLGADALADLPHWREPGEIVRLARLAVAPRPGAPPPEPPAGTAVTPVDMPGFAISSSLIQQRVAEGKGIRYLVPDAVEGYIREQGLYREGR